MKNGLSDAALWIGEAAEIAVLTGAGVSAESGVPTFRGTDGLWRKYRAEELATPEAFARDPDLVWEWYRYRQKIIAAAEPNGAHHALAELERRTERFTLITQNVDGLHLRAGSQCVVELHGNIFRARSPEDGEIRTLTGAEEETIPLSSKGNRMRPDIVWFGEALPMKAIEAAHGASESADLFLVVGTSAIVHPAASFPLLARESGAKLIEVNPEETPLTPAVNLSLRGKAAEILPMIIDRLGIAEPPERRGS